VRHGADLAWDVQRVLLADRMHGWTLDYIDSLDEFEVLAILSVLEGKAKAEAK